MAMTKSQRRRVTMGVRYVVLSVWALIAFFPIYWIVSTSFKLDTQWFAWPPYYFPRPADARQLHERLVWRRGICADAVFHFVAERH